MVNSNVYRRLRQHGWSVTERTPQSLQLPAEIAIRHPKIPASLTAFLGGLADCTNSTNTAWFLCEADYAGTSESAFRWNEWELLSLGAGVDDPPFTVKVQSFWNAHLPFYLSVADGYEYYAVRTTTDGFGRVVAGREPEFEEGHVVAASFEEFLWTLVSGPKGRTKRGT